MNKNRFRKVFSKRLGMLVAVGENAKGRSKVQGEGIGGGSVSDTHVVSGIRRGVLAIVLALTQTTAFAQSLPTGGQYTAGSGNISTNGNTLTVDQNTQRGVINWNTFNVGAGNTVQFNQPNAQSKTLNIVSGGVPSNIQGSLLANGQIFIQNSSGILFGKGAVVNVGSLLATTKAIDPNAFMNGDVLTLSSTGQSGLVQNDGNIQAAGFVTLVGDQVRNTGSITVPGGQVVLAAGDSATVALANGQGLSLTLTNATASALVENSGQIVADNGSVLLTARGSDTLLKTVINMSGVVQAGSGAIVADAGSTGDVIVSGKFDASNMSAGGVGGDVVLSGNRIGLSDTARIDVSGDGDAGYAVIGGDTLHKVPGTKAAALIDSVTFADTVQIDRGAQIMARSVHGNGGFLETSGRYLNMQGQVDASAPNGKNGSWLIDPTDVTISADPDANSTVDTANGTFTWNSGSATATVNNVSLVNALNGGTDVTITTASDGPSTGNISVKADIVTNSTQSANLTLFANNSLYIGDQTDVRIAADGGGALNVNMVATDGSAYVGSADHTVTFDTKGDVSITGGNEASDEVGLQLAGNVNVLSGNVALTGTSGSKNGVNELAGSAINVRNDGHLNITGTSKTLIGVNISNLAVSDSATVGVIGEGVTTGVIANNIGVSDNGALDIVGNAAALEVGATLVGASVINLTIGGSGSTNISGIANVSGSSNYATAVALSDANVGEFGSLNIVGDTDGRTNNSAAVRITNLNASGHAAVNVTGDSRYNGAFISPVGISANTVNVKDNASVKFTGIAESGEGIYANHISVSGEGTIDIIGTANGSNSHENRAAVIVSNVGVSGDGSANITGSGYIGISANHIDVSEHGSVNVTGNGSGSTGISVNNVNVSGGSANFSGIGRGNGGGIITSSVNASNDGSINFNGTSTGGGDGVSATLLSVSNSARIDFVGTATGLGVGVNATGVNTFDQASVKFTGTADSNSSVNVANLAVSGGSVDVVGNSTGASAGITVTNVTASGGTLSVTGTSTGSGVAVSATDVTASGGVIDVTGTSTGSGSGVRATNVTASGTGSIHINGASAAKAGIEVEHVAASDTGSIDLTGHGATSGISATGVDVSGGAVKMNGTSQIGDGVVLLADANALGASVTVSGDGELAVAGASDSGRGVSLPAGVDVSGGRLTLSGSSTSGIGFLGSGGPINVSGDGVANFSGASIDASGVQIGSQVNVSESGRASISGTSTAGSGVVLDQQTGIVTASGNASVTLTGTSVEGPGVQIDGSVFVDDSSSLQIAGLSTNGTGTQISTGTVIISDNGLGNVTGNSTVGAGVILGHLEVWDSGSATIAGTSAEGPGVQIDGSANTYENGVLQIAGLSTNGSGVNINGTVDVSDNGFTDIRANSTNGTSWIQGGNSSITASDDSVLNVSAPGNANGSIVVGKFGNATVNIDTSIHDNNTTPTNPTDPTGPTHPTDPTNNTPGDGGVTDPTSGDSGSGSSSVGGIVGGVLGAVGLGTLILNTHGVMYLEQPVQLAVDSGDVSYWGKVSLEHLQIDLSGDQAEMALRTPDGPVKRQLKLMDGGDGVKHYTSVDEQTGIKSDLTFNPKTSEYFYTETGTKVGNAYKVSTHGWLKERGTLGAPSPLADASMPVTQTAHAAQVSSIAK